MWSVSSVEYPHPIGKSVYVHTHHFSITVPVGFFLKASMTTRLWPVRGVFLWLYENLPSIPDLGVTCLMLIICSSRPSMVGSKEYFLCS